MKIIKPSFTIEDKLDGREILKKIEKAARTCYKSEDLITEESAKIMVKKLIESGHHSVLEHEKVTVRIICDRGVSHELVRHRIASFSQESSRYCNYSKNKFDQEVTFIELKDFLKNPKSLEVWLRALKQSEENYLELISLGESPQIARSVLVHSLKTELVITGNLREWRVIFQQRTSKKAHPQMVEIMIPLLKEFQKQLPIIFDDIVVDVL